MLKKLAKISLSMSLTSLALVNIIPQEVEAAKADNSIVFVMPEKAVVEGGFDPITGWGQHGFQIFQSALLKRLPDFSAAPDLATDYSVSEDGLSWTFNLRDDVKFSDGEEFTAEDVVFTFNQIKENASVIDLTNLESVVAVNDYQVVFHLVAPNSTFIESVIGTGIVPEHAYSSDYANIPIGTGPFELIEYREGEQLITKPNPNYYGDPVPFDQLTVVWLSTEAALAATQAGQADVAFIPSNLAEQNISDMTLYSIPSVENRGIAYVMQAEEGNTTENGYPIGNNVTSDYAIRYAIDRAVNRDILIQGVAQGHGTIATSVADGMPWWDEELSQITEEYGQADLALAVLEEHGWIDSDGDGIREKDGIKAAFNLIYLATDEIRQGIAISVADQVRPLGIEITPVGMSWDQTEEAMHSNAVVLGWGGFNPLETYYLYHSDFAGVDYYNTGYYSNEKVDSYLDQAIASISQEEAMENWQKAHWDGETGFSSYGDVSWSWLYNANHTYYINDELKIGEPIIQPHHGQGWAMLANIGEWSWNE